MPKYRSGMWDGKIRLFKLQSRKIAVGLLSQVIAFCESRGYQYVVDPKVLAPVNTLSHEKAKKFIKALKLPFEPWEEQYNAFFKMANEQRGIVLSPTASGKSLIIYMLARYFMTQIDEKIVVIVPTTNLVEQLYTDFEEYGFNSEKYVHRIYSEKERTTDKQIIITTWQTLVKMKEFHKNIGVIFGDEAHGFEAKSLSTIMEGAVNAKVRIGLTGTLKDTATNELTLIGHFGPVFVAATTANLMAQGKIARLTIKCIVLQYPPEIRKMASKFDYNEEIDFLCANEKRNKFIQNLAFSLKGVNLTLFQYVDKHGKILYNNFINLAKRPVYYIDGNVSVERREEIRSKLATDEECDLLASLGTFSTGVNAPRINHIISASPTKAKVRLLQSIGRGLRKSGLKDSCVLIDVVDDLSWKKKKNTTLEHFYERVKIYNQQEFEYKIIPVNFGG